MKKITLNELVNTNNNTTRAKAYITYDSKKKFLADGETVNKINTINAECIDCIRQLKNVFAVAVNTTDSNYMVLTMYYSTTKTYEYFALDVTTLDCTGFESIKGAKQYINGLIDGEKSTTK